jgi:hypothetical protein
MMAPAFQETALMVLALRYSARPSNTLTNTQPAKKRSYATQPSKKLKLSQDQGEESLPKRRSALALTLIVIITTITNFFCTHLSKTYTNLY